MNLKVCVELRIYMYKRCVLFCLLLVFRSEKTPECCPSVWVTVMDSELFDPETNEDMNEWRLNNLSWTQNFGYGNYYFLSYWNKIQLVGCLADWFCYLVGWLVYLLICWLVGWLVYWFIGWFCRLISWSVNRLVDWLIDRDRSNSAY